MKMPQPDEMVMAKRSNLVQRFRNFLPEDSVIDDNDALKVYETDGLTAYRQLPMIVVLPNTTAQVAEILKTVVRKYNLQLDKISYAGYIPYDSKIKNSLINRKRAPFMLENPDSLSVKCIQVIAKRMISSLAQYSVTKNFFSQFEQIREKSQGK